MSLIKKIKENSANISILYVEDDKDLQKSVSSYLNIIFDKVDLADDGQEALDTLNKKDYDIIITDIQMPRMNGLEMIKVIREKNPHQEILITTAFLEPAYMMEAISLDVNGYILKPIDFDKINATLYKSVTNIVLSRENREYKIKLEDMVQVRTEQNTLLEKEKIDNYEKTLLSLVELVEKRDAYTGGHSIRVATYSQIIAKEMGYDERSCKLLYRAGILHDIGKIETPDAVLLKPGKLDDLEYSLIQEHVSTGYKLLNKIPMYKELSEIIASHHERCDGKGYPKGLINDEIPELTRVMVVADAFDAMTTNRIYKPRISVEQAIQELQVHSGTQFDKTVVHSAIKSLSDINIDEDIGQLPSTQMQNKRFAYFFEDQTTQAYNQDYLELSLIQNSSSLDISYVDIICLHHFTALNAQRGWDSGNVFLKEIVTMLKSHYTEASVFRIHGDDFVVISKRDIKLDRSIFDNLIKEYDSVIDVSQQRFNTEEYKIDSIAELEKVLQQNS